MNILINYIAKKQLKEVNSDSQHWLHIRSSWRNFKNIPLPQAHSQRILVSWSGVKGRHQHLKKSAPSNSNVQPDQEFLGQMEAELKVRLTYICRIQPHVSLVLWSECTPLQIHVLKS